MKTSNDAINVYGGKIKNKYHLNKSHIYSPLRFPPFSLYQAGRLFCSTDTEIDEHIQFPLFELTVVTSGEGTVFTNGIGSKVSAHDIYVSFPGDKHAIKTDKQKLLHYDFIAFNTDDSEYFSQLEKISYAYSQVEKRIIHDERIERIVSALISETDTENQYSDRLITSLLEQLTVYLIRDFAQVNPISTKPENLCYLVMNYIDTHIFTMRSLSELATVTNYNYAYLSHVFATETSSTIATYYKNKKMDVAKSLLLSGDTTVTEISSLLGYTSVYAFSKAYKAFYGHSPTSTESK